MGGRSAGSREPDRHSDSQEAGALKCLSVRSCRSLITSMDMFQNAKSVAFFVAGLAIGASGVTGLLAQRQNQTKELMRMDLPGCSGKEVAATVQNVAPGDSGKHFHSGSSFTYVLEGSETWEVDGKPSVTVTQGDFMYDEARHLHRTVNTAPLKLLILRILDKGEPATIRP
jgi:quercetin dioxygenase-like cupin family protein